MGLFSQVSSAVARGGQGLKTSKDERPPEGANAEDTEELDEESVSYTHLTLPTKRIV